MKGRNKKIKVKQVFLDIDGVIIGTQYGYNFPQPNVEVVNKFGKINREGVKVTLCTAKAFFCVRKTIELCELNSYHITDGGAVIYNPFTGEKHITAVDKIASLPLVIELEKNKIYTEIYTIDNYYITTTDSDITEKHTNVLGQEPKITPDIKKVLETEEVIKIMLISTNDVQKALINNLGEKFENNFSLSWGIHPTMLPMEVAWFTAKGINKKSAVEKIMTLNNVTPAESLAVGDSTGDWDFMQLCDNVATLENGTTEIKKLVFGKRPYGHLAPSVEENGILNIFNYFHI